ncbi:DUF2203 domain-containing protein [Gimesia panareensis]|uniref:DUF2203 domain-containing protein n=1 Tax=Gimesia panareensis TaxID=2527978 RepID=A0A518A9U2_9PLAN|nr:DUF2203 domain-containing protein [Gimesia panareensis]QDT28630.1 hypothetical protein Enr10x_39740 [Gimesia panareensis]QDU51485.1 hypothetical protein Pan110_38510 [Gimesia panareensis]QDV19373.1 hypothetical protein Pan153_40380 [Gimesia panareensis]
MNAEAQRKLIFTPDEANLRLPLVRAIVKDIVALYESLHDRQERIAEIKHLPGSTTRDEDSVYSEELLQAEIDIENDKEQLKAYEDELSELGVELEDPAQGVVNFPALREGKEIYLCWKLGEEEVGYWHSFDEGFSERRSLLEESIDNDDRNDMLM